MANLYPYITNNYSSYSTATHYTVSEIIPSNASTATPEQIALTTYVISVYDDFGKDSLAPIDKIKRALFVEVLEYHLGEDNDWAKIKILDNSNDISFTGAVDDQLRATCYVKIFDILPIEEISFTTARLAHLVEKPDLNFVVPDWRKKDENSPFYNRKTQEYWITITADTFSMPSEIEQEDAVRNGIVGLCEYFAKQYDRDSVERYMGNSGFAQIKEFYVPSRPETKTKCLISIHAKYFNGIPQKTLDGSMLQNYLVDGKTVLLNTSKLTGQINYIIRRFDSFDQSVRNFKGSVKNVDFKKEKKNLRDFFLGLKKLISENGMDFIETEEFMIEIGVGNNSKTTSLNSGHAHSYTIDDSGNGWAEYALHPLNNDVKHRHEVINYVVQEAASECYPNCFMEHGVQGVGPHIHELLGLNDDEDTCANVLYVLYSTPYSQQMLVGFNKFKNSNFSKRGNTINIITSLYDVLVDLNSNIDWIKFASKYFTKPPIINPTKKLSKASKKKRQRRSAVDSFNSKTRLLNETPFFDIKELDKINRYISDPNIRASFLAENLLGETFIGDAIFNLLSTIVENVGTLGDVYKEILFKVGLKDIIATTLAFATREMKQEDTQQVIVRGYLQSLPYSKMNNVVFHRDMPEVAHLKIFHDLFKNLRMTVDEYLALLREIGVDQRHMFSWTVVDYDNSSSSTFQQDFNADGTIDSEDIGYIPGIPQGIMSEIDNPLFQHYSYKGVVVENVDFDTFSEYGAYDKCKVKLEDFLSYEGMVISLTYLMVYGTSRDDTFSERIVYNYDDQMNAKDFVNEYQEEFPIITDDYVEIENIDREEIKNRLVKALPKVFNKQDISDSFNKSIKEIMAKPFAEMDILQPDDPMTEKVYNLLGAPTDGYAEWPIEIDDFLKVAVDKVKIEKDLSAFYGFVKETDTKYSNIFGNFEIPDISLGKLKFDFNFNNVMLNPTFDLTMFNIKFNDDIMGDVMSMIIVAVKEAIKAAILSIIQSLISSLTEAINGVASAPVTNAMYGQECLQDLFEASSGTSSWEAMVEDIFSEARKKAESNCKFCPPISKGESLSFFQKACNALTPNELVDLVKGSSRGGLKPDTAIVLMDIANQYPNIKCILDNDILEEMFEEVGEAIDDDLLSVVDQMYRIEPSGEALSSCLVSKGSGTSYGEATIQSPFADLDAPCVDSDGDNGDCNTLPRQFKSVRDFMECRGLSEADIVSQINRAVEKKKDDLVDMIAAANKKGTDLINMEDMCNFLPKPSQIPALKFSSDIAFESIMGGIRLAYAGDVVTYPDIMIHKDPEDGDDDENKQWIPLKLVAGDFSHYTYDDNYALTPVYVGDEPDENGDDIERVVNPVFRREYIGGEQVYQLVGSGFGEDYDKISVFDVTQANGQTESISIHEMILGTVQSGEFEEDTPNRVPPSNPNLYIMRKVEIGKVAPLLRKELKDFQNRLSFDWSVFPGFGNGGEYSVSIDDVITMTLSPEDDYLVLPADLTSKSPQCEEMEKLNLVAFCAIEEQYIPSGAGEDYAYNWISNDWPMYDGLLLDYVLTKIHGDGNQIDNDPFYIGSGPWETDMPTWPLHSNYILAFTHDTNQTSNIAENILLPHQNTGTATDVSLGDNYPHWPGHYHNMIQSVMDLFAEVLTESDLFEVIKMQLFRIEPRDTDINKVNVDKRGKSLLDIDGAIVRAKEHFENNCSFKDMPPDGRTQLQQSALVAVVELIIRIYLIDMLLRGVFLLDKVLLRSDSISGAFYALLYSNFKKDMQQFSPEFYEQFLDEMAYIYNERRLNDSSLPQVTDKPQMLKFLMKEQLILMNKSLQSVFKEAHKSVKRAFLDSLPLVDQGDYLSMVMRSNANNVINIPEEFTFSFEDLTLTQKASFFSGVEELSNLEDDIIQDIRPSFYIKRYFINNGKKVDWHPNYYDTLGDNQNFDSGIEICFFDNDPNVNVDYFSTDSDMPNKVDGLASYIAALEFEGTSDITSTNDYFEDYWTSRFAVSGIKCFRRNRETNGDSNWHYCLYKSADVPKVPDIYEWFFGIKYQSVGGGSSFWDESAEYSRADIQKAFLKGFDGSSMSHFYELHRNFWDIIDKSNLSNTMDAHEWARKIAFSYFRQGAMNFEQEWEEPYTASGFHNPDIWVDGAIPGVKPNDWTEFDIALKGQVKDIAKNRKISFIWPRDSRYSPAICGHGPEDTVFPYYSWFWIYEYKEDGNGGEMVEHGPFKLNPNGPGAVEEGDTGAWFTAAVTSYNDTPYHHYISDYQGFKELVESDYMQNKYLEYYESILQDLVESTGAPAPPIRFKDMATGMYPKDEYKGSFVSIPIAQSDTIQQYILYKPARLAKYGDYWQEKLEHTFDKMVNDAGSDFNKFFNKVIPIEKLYDVFFSYCVAAASKNVPAIEDIFKTSKQQLKMTFETLVKRFDNFEYRDGDIQEQGGTAAMYQRANTVTSTSPDFSAIAAKFAAMAPKMIIKGLAETFDPNIKIAKFIRMGAMAAGVDIKPVEASIAALPMNVIPFAPGPPIGPLGLMYLASDFLEPKEREKLSEIHDGINNSVSPTGEEVVVVEEVEPSGSESGSDAIDESNIQPIEWADPVGDALGLFKDVMLKVWAYIISEDGEYDMSTLRPRWGKWLLESDSDTHNWHRHMMIRNTGFNDWNLNGTDPFDGPRSFAGNMFYMMMYLRQTSGAAYPEGFSGDDYPFEALPEHEWNYFVLNDFLYPFQKQWVAGARSWNVYISMWQFFWKLIVMYDGANRITPAEVLQTIDNAGYGASHIPFTFNYARKITPQQIAGFIEEAYDYSGFDFASAEGIENADIKAMFSGDFGNLIIKGTMDLVLDYAWESLSGGYGQSEKEKTGSGRHTWKHEELFAPYQGYIWNIFNGGVYRYFHFKCVNGVKSMDDPEEEYFEYTPVANGPNAPVKRLYYADVISMTTLV